MQHPGKGKKIFLEKGFSWFLLGRGEGFHGKRIFLGREVLFLTPGMVLELPKRPPGGWTGSSPEEYSQGPELPMARNHQGGRAGLVTPPGKLEKLWEAPGALSWAGGAGKTLPSAQAVLVPRLCGAVWGHSPSSCCFSHPSLGMAHP